MYIKFKLCPTRKGIQEDLLLVDTCNFHGFCCVHRLTYLGKVKKAPCKNNKKSHCHNSFSFDFPVLYAL